MIQMTHARGFVALTAVLVLSALFLSLSIGAARRSIDATERSFAQNWSAGARMYAEACATRALMEHTRSLHYTGDETFTVGEGECTILPIALESDGTRTIQTTSTVSGSVYRITVEVSAISPELVVHSYQSATTF